MKEKIKNIPASVRARLQNKAKETSLLNSRMKDFYDIWLMMRLFDFNGLKLAGALKRTFKHRKTSLPQPPSLFSEEIYDEKSDRHTLWKTFLKKGHIKHAPEKLSIIAERLRNFL